MKVLSLFDGMSCGRIALDRLGIPVEKYYASEIDKYAIQVSQANYPDIIQVGDICDLDPKDYMDVDLMPAGSPCQGFSLAGKQLAFDDPRSALFFEFIRLLKEIKPKYFLLENVRMKKEFLQVISEQVSDCYPEIPFGIEPIFINSSLLSAQSRQRYYWTNIPNIQQPEDKGIVLRDILETEVDNNLDKMTSKEGKAHCLTASYTGAVPWNSIEKRQRTMVPVNKPKQVGIAVDVKGFDIQKRVYSLDGKSPTIMEAAGTGGGRVPKIETKPKQVGIAVDINGHDILKRVYSPDGKSPTVTACSGGNNEPKVVTGGAFRGRAYDKDGKRMDRDGSSVANKTKQMLELRKDNKSNAITTVGKDSVVASEDLTWRKLTPLECERLQTVPDNYTNHVSNTQRYKMLGNGWTVDVICHIFKNME